jgi:Protein of unknown function (DUF760)
MLLKYCAEVEPSIVDTFDRSAPPHVAEAVRATVSSLLGSLPPQFFEVNVVTLGDNLRSLFYSFLMTGYMYRHVVDELEMQRGLDKALPGSVLEDDLEQDVKPGRKMGLRSQNFDGYAQVRLVHVLTRATKLNVLALNVMLSADMTLLVHANESRCGRHRRGLMRTTRYHHLSTDFTDEQRCSFTLTTPVPRLTPVHTTPQRFCILHHHPQR